MSVASFIADAGTLVAIEADSTASGPAQTTMGGVDRSVDSWMVMVDAVPCLIDVQAAKRYVINNQVQYESMALIFMNADPVPGGLNITHRLRVTNFGKPGPSVGGIWMITSVSDPIPFGHHLEVMALRVGLP